jgi:hypothetical protein
MAMTDRFGASEHADRPARDASLAWLRESTTWFAAAVVGMAIVFAGLAVDGYRHNHSAAEESLLSFGNPGHLIAAIGLVLTSISVLAGFSIAALKDVKTADHAIRRAVPVTALWVMLTAVAIGSLTYLGASGATIGHSHGTDTASAVADTHVHTDTTGGDAGVAAALQQQGIDPGGSDGQQVAGGATSTPGASASVDPASVPGALTQGSNGEAGGHQHDHGKQPTFTQVSTMTDAQLLPLFPANTVSAADLPTLKQQVEQVRAVAERIDTPEKAKAAGYVNTTSDVPYMGEHYLNYDYVKDGKFDPSKPEGLLFSKIDSGEEKLVGVWFLQIPGIGGVTRDTEPAGFASNLDLWHAHTGLCLVGTKSASEGETKDSCTAKGGSFTPDLRWMMHVWVTPETTENPDGMFAYLNSDLFNKQQAAAKQASNPTGQTQ